jgi:hypothetical protein
MLFFPQRQMIELRYSKPRWTVMTYDGGVKTGPQPFIPHCIVSTYMTKDVPILQRG